MSSFACLPSSRNPIKFSLRFSVPNFNEFSPRRKASHHFAFLSYIGQLPCQTVCHQVCHRHGVLDFVSCVLEHVTLVTSTNVEIITGDVDTTCNIRAWLAAGHPCCAILVVQTHVVCAAQVVNEPIEDDVHHNTFFLRAVTKNLHSHTWESPVPAITDHLMHAGDVAVSPTVRARTTHTREPRHN